MLPNQGVGSDSENSDGSCSDDASDYSGDDDKDKKKKRKNKAKKKKGDKKD